MRVIKGKLRPGIIFQFVFLLHLVVCQPHSLLGQVPAQSTPAAPTDRAINDRAIHGVVKSGNMPIPGAGISATNTATKEQVNTWTDVDGSYRLRIPADGNYTVRVQMAAFAASSQEVVLDATHQDVPDEFRIDSAVAGTRGCPDATHETTSGARTPARSERTRLSESFRVSERSGTGCGRRLYERRGPVRHASSGHRAGQRYGIRSDLRQHLQFIQCDERRRNAAALQRCPPTGRRIRRWRRIWRSGRWFRRRRLWWRADFGRRGFDINRPHGSLYYGVGDSALNASPFSLTGAAHGKARDTCRTASAAPWAGR